MTEAPVATGEATDLAAWVRAVIREAHDRIESLPISVALLEGRVGRAAYVRLLAGVAPAHAALERGLERWPELAFVSASDHRRADVCARDLAVLGGAPAGADATPEASALRDHVALAADVSPWATLGCFYVLEGSRMGSLLLAAPIARGLGVPCEPGQGVDYHLAGGETFPARWRAFKATLGERVPGAGPAGALAHAALSTMELLHDHYEACGRAGVSA